MTSHVHYIFVDVGDDDDCRKRRSTRFILSVMTQLQKTQSSKHLLRNRGKE
jgi:hypothetical protein